MLNWLIWPGSLNKSICNSTAVPLRKETHGSIIFICKATLWSVVIGGGYCASEVRSMQYRRIQNALGVGYCCNRADHERADCGLQLTQMLSFTFAIFLFLWLETIIKLTCEPSPQTVGTVSPTFQMGRTSHSPTSPEWWADFSLHSSGKTSKAAFNSFSS